MNETLLLDQIRVYSEALVEDLPDPAANIAKAPAPLATRPPQGNLGWLVAVAAAALILVLVGGVAWLSPFSGTSVPPANEPAETTIPPETTIPDGDDRTETSLTPTAEPTDTTLAAAPIPPPGEGPTLEFVRIEVPIEVVPWSGVWFQGALHGIAGGGPGELFRSSKGFTWEPVPGFPGTGDQGGVLLTDGNLLVSVGMEEAEENQRCATAGDAIVVHTSANGVDWVSSRVQLPIPSSPNPVGCYSAFIGRGDGSAIGPQGIMVTALIQGEIDVESIIEAELGLGLEPETLQVGIGGGIVEVKTEAGDVYEIDLDAAGYLDDIESFLAEASDDPDVASLVLDGSWHTGRGYAWFSPDGQTWTQLDATGPLDGGAIEDIVATPDGFVATSTSSGSPGLPGPAQGVLWETTDGRTWTQKSTLIESHLSSPSRLDEWNGRLVAITGDGVWTIEGTPQQLITTSMGVMEVGEFGLVGMRSEMEGGGTEVIFSADGTTWNRWTPPEFGPEGTIYVLGIADDFVVVRLQRWDEATQTGDASVWVGRLP